MYFVDQNQINKTLVYMEQLIDIFEKETNWLQSDVNKLALERIAHGLIEGIIDVGNSMIDGFIMRDPGSYDDIIDILEDEKVIQSEQAIPLKAFISLRPMIVRQFVEVDSDKVARSIRETLDELQQFPGQVRDYLTNELGPVSAFLPTE
ncbi:MULTISPECIES: DUF86 domain-containing protein [unclassified Sporosarcina]|uniref:DUF86 domain-containing protein n=1 Tax=unclassified Sporosarcina TaxID=2647733 RepID=UPI000C16A97A|nr:MULTISPECIES: DUF86 domain-containing protein [unclassified Sporosarcina]PIC85593.1 hypothetical protein CSV72_12755 [Sporosarcina sp. P20a]PIC99272.1 hypothetical protein CSV68_09230 [Sporosarcina sp. P29]PID05369.1 hypothetical protein CSV66_10025 [Sporosarcina sp. P30]PID08564.1 hypothetical protein CSV65_10025 [Sporosarcina sp. P31]PID11566.1 hypothetical protein CSV64_10990 [Sporosarcina sp. P32b]